MYTIHLQLLRWKIGNSSIKNGCQKIGDGKYLDNTYTLLYMYMINKLIPSPTKRNMK